MMMLRGSSLKNTEWVYGVAVFTGHETKIMKNSVRAKAKKSTIDKSTNRYILVTIMIQSLICAVAGTYNAVWDKGWGVNIPYLQLPPEANLVASIPIGFGTWFLALMNFVAISMIVTLETVKFF